jgi:hypothetical protein
VRIAVLSASRTVLAFALVGFVARTTSPQSTFEITPSMLVAFVSDSNPLARANANQSDIIGRLSPIVDVDFRTRRMTLAARATGDMERFTQNQSLTSLDARKQFAVDGRYHVGRRMTVRADAIYLQTQVPGELNLVSGAAVARGAARRLSVAPAATYQFTDHLQGSARYAVSEDRLAGGVPVITQTAAFAGVRRLSPRASMRVDVLVRGYDFGATDHARSHTLSVGWTRDVTRTTRVSIAGGPRISDGSVAPDISTLFEYGARAAGWSIGYARVETVLIGLAGAADTDSLSASAFHGPADGLRVRVAPSMMRTSRAGLAARVYRLAIGATWPLSPWLAVDAGYEALRQRGDLYVARADGRISRHVVSVGLAMAQRRRVTP